MSAAWLIGVQFVREQRIALYVILGWTLAFGIFLSAVHRRGEGTEDLELVFKQQAAYGIVLALFLASAAIHGDRKSRRIIGVLAKGIYRAEYLGGLLLGSTLLIAIYYAAMGAVYGFIAMQLGYPARLFGMSLALLVAATLASAIALFFSTFLPPLVAMLGSSLVLALPYGAAAILGKSALLGVPVAHVLDRMGGFTFAAGWKGGWEFAAIAAVEVALLFAMASAIFAHRDVTLPVE